MSAKRPPEYLIEEIFAICAEKTSGAQIIEKLGRPSGTVKPAIAWMLEKGCLLGYRGGGKGRYCGYVQRTQATEALLRPQSGPESFSFAVLEEFWPLSEIEVRHLRVLKPDFEHELRR